MPFDATLFHGLEKPARYLGLEPGAKANERPDHKGRLFRVALAFPDLYEIAHGHLGHKILYHMLNGRPGLSAERAYAPWLDLEERLRRLRSPLLSLETARPLSGFDMIGFSLQYEMGYTNIINMLELSGLDPLAANRPEGAPLVVGGGPGASNPEPLADFFDFFFLGDAEASLMDDFEIISQWRHERAPRRELFARLAGRPGIYVPSLFGPVYEKGRLAGMEPLMPGHLTVTRAVAAGLKGAPFPVCQISPLVKPVHDRVVVEIGRGCSRGCRFCQAGFLYRPVRERDAGEVLDLIRRNLSSTGQDSAAFLSLSAGDHSQIGAMVEGFMDAHSAAAVSLSLPSLRVKSLSDGLARQIRRVRKTGFTLAPEAGTARLRAVINKDLTEDDIFQAAEVAFGLGWRTLKLYFMAGLPTETEEDLRAIASLGQRIKRLSRAKINLGLAHFTPKAHTPFQWQPGSGVEDIRRRLAIVREASRLPGLQVRFNDPGVSFVEGLLSRGDRRLGRLILEVQRRGARFEAWNDHFRLDLWLSSIDALGLDAAELLRARDTGEVLPWDHLFCGVSKDYLAGELDKALKAQTTADCRQAGCLGCGACHGPARIDLAGPLPPAAKAPPAPVAARAWPRSAPGRPLPEYRYLARFAKDGPMALLGHLEMVEAFKRAFRRAGLDLALSQGFHPLPKLSFLTALPLGVPSLDECLLFSLSSHAPAAEVGPLIALPEGLRLAKVESLPSQGPKPKALAARWMVASPGPAFGGGPLPSATRLSYEDPKRGRRDFLLADHILEASSPDPFHAILTIRIGEHGTPKPIEAARTMWGLPAGLQASLVKLSTILDTDPPARNT